MNRVAVIGGGSWGTALARLLCNKGIDTIMYVRDNSQLENMKNSGYNKKYLGNVKLPKNLALTSSLKDAIVERSHIIMAVPTASFRDVFNSCKVNLVPEQIVVNVAKGIENNSLERLSEIAQDIKPDQPFVTLSGPSHAEEVGTDHPTTVTVASTQMKYAENVQSLFKTKNFRVYTNADMIGVELGGALKNIIAVAAGISDGMGYGDNTKAALMTRGITEMARLGIALGAKAETFFGLSGIGDLIVTCTSMHSRNRRAGLLIGQGMSVDQAIKEVGMVVEGIKTTKSAYDLKIKHGVDMPITNMLYEILYKGVSIEHIIDDLMLRQLKNETEGLVFGS